MDFEKPKEFDNLKKSLRDLLSFFDYPRISNAELERLYSMNKINKEIITLNIPQNYRTFHSLIGSQKKNTKHLSYDPIQIISTKCSINNKKDEFLKILMDSPAALSVTSKGQKSSRVEDFLNNPEGKILIFEIQNYKKLRELWDWFPKSFFIDSPTNAGRFLDHTNKAQIRFVGPNTTWKLDNPYGCILINFSYRIVNLWTINDSKEHIFIDFIKKNKPIWKNSLLWNHFAFIVPRQDIGISADGFSIIVSWPFMPLTDEFIDFHSPIYLLKALNCPKTPKNILPRIRELMTLQTKVEDLELLECLQKNSMEIKAGIYKVNDEEYRKYSGYDYNISLETNISAPEICKCGKEINKWIFIRYFENFRYESWCIKCLFEVNSNEGDMIMRRYKGCEFEIDNPFDFLFKNVMEENNKSAINNENRKTFEDIEAPKKKICLEQNKYCDISKNNILIEKDINGSEAFEKSKYISKSGNIEKNSEIIIIKPTEIDKHHEEIDTLLKNISDCESTEEMKSEVCDENPEMHQIEQWFLLSEDEVDENLDDTIINKDEERNKEKAIVGSKIVKNENAVIRHKTEFVDDIKTVNVYYY